MLPKYKNNSFATLNGSHSAGSDTLSVDSTTLLPTITAGQFFYVTVWNRATYINPGEDPLMEICKVTGMADSTLTLEAATANPHGSGSMVAVLLTENFFTDLETEFGTHTHDYIPTTEKAAANGIATLDATGNVPANQLGNVEAGGIGIIPKTVRFDGVLAAGNAQQFSSLEVDATLQTVRAVLRGSLPVGASIKVQVTKNGASPTNSVFVADEPIEITASASPQPNGLYVVEGTLDSGEVICSALDWFQATITQVGSDYAGNDLDVQLVFE